MATLGTQDTGRRQTKNTTTFVGHRYTQTNTNDVNKKLTILHTIRDKDESNIVFMRNRNGHHNTEPRT